MKKQVLELKDFQKWLEETETMYAQDATRKLTTTVSGGIRVYKDKLLIWQGVQPYAAIEKYNSL